jgi:hypothetical protein
VRAIYGDFVTVLFMRFEPGQGSRILRQQDAGSCSRGGLMGRATLFADGPEYT